MQNPALDLLALPAVAVEEALHQPADLSADHFRNIFCQQDVESGIAQIKAHRSQRIGKRVSFCFENLRSPHLFPADHHGCRAVTKENRRNQVGLRNVLALKSERWQLHRDDQDVSARLGLQEIGRPAQGHGARSATEFRERHAAHVRAEAHQIDQVSVQRRNHEARAGHRDNHVDFIWLQARALQAFFRRFPA